MNLTTTESGFSLASDGPPVVGVFTWNGQLMRFTPNSPLSVGHEYIIKVMGARDVAGNQIVLPIESRFITMDLWPPKVTVLSPKSDDLWSSQPHEIKYAIIENGTIPAGGVNISYSTDNGTSWGAAGSYLNNTGQYIWKIPSGIDTKEALIRIMATDLAGNTGWNVSGKFKIDSTSPLINSTSPSNASSDIPVAANMTVRFTEPMNRTSVEKSFSMTWSKGKVNGAFDWKGNTLTFTPDRKLDSYATYWYNFSGSDIAGNAVQPASIQFRTTDIIGPVITIIAPSKGQYVNGTGPFPIRYTISDQSGIMPQSVNISVRNSTGNISWTPIKNCTGLSNLTTCLWDLKKNIEDPHVFLKVEARDLYGNLGLAISSDSFVLDTMPPTVFASDPMRNETGVSLRPDISITFSERMSQASVEFTIQPYVEVAKSWGSNTTLLLKLKNAQDSLQPGTRYSILITSGTDVAGNPIGFFNLTFTTTFQTIRGSITGVAITIDVALLSDVDVVARFNGTIVGTIKTGNNGTFRFVDLEPGEYEVTLRKEGYYNKTVKAKVEVGKETNLGGIVLGAKPGSVDWLPIIVLIAAVVALAIVMVYVYVRSHKMEEADRFVRHLTSEHAKETAERPETEKEKPRKEPEEKGLEIEPGESYLLSENGSESGYRELSYLVMSGLVGVCITAKSPKTLWERELSLVSRERKGQLGDGSQPFFFLDLATRSVEMKGFDDKKGQIRTDDQKAKRTEKKEEEDEDVPATRGRVEFIVLRGKRKPEAKVFSRGIWRFMMERPKNVVYVDSISDFMTSFGAPAKDMLAAMVKEAKDTGTTLIASLGEIDSKVKGELEDLFENVYEPDI
jgi:hypothetical protein